MQSHAKSFAQIESDKTLREGVSSLVSNISCSKQSNFLLHRTSHLQRFSAPYCNVTSHIFFILYCRLSLGEAYYRCWENNCFSRLCAAYQRQQETILKSNKIFKYIPLSYPICLLSELGCNGKKVLLPSPVTLLSPPHLRFVVLIHQQRPYDPTTTKSMKTLLKNTLHIL